MSNLLLLILFSLTMISFDSKDDRKIDLQKYFDEFDVRGSFVLYDLG